MHTSQALLPVRAFLVSASLCLAAARAPAQTAAQKLLFPGPEYVSKGVANEIVLGDFDGDGLVDVAGAAVPGGGLTSIPGHGDGTFGGAYPAVPYAANYEVLERADLDGDGVFDLVSDGGFAQVVNVHLATGSGGFLPAVATPVQDSVEGLGFADFDLDGKLDMAVATSSLASPSFDYVDIRLGAGDGTFAPAPSVPAGSHPSALALGDFDGDGLTDLAVNNVESGIVRVYFGTGAGGFYPAGFFGTGLSDPTTLISADWNQDGALDLALGNAPYYDSGLALLLGNGRGSFASPSLVSSSTGQIAQLAAADLDQDGALDLVAAAYDAAATVLFGNGAGTFGPATVYGGTGGRSLGVDDLNGDGWLDLAAGTYNSSFIVLLALPGAGFAGSGVWPLVPGGGGSPFDGAPELGDFDGDAHLDLAATTESGGPKLSLLRGNGDGSFAVPLLTDLMGSALVATGDLNGNGLLDLVVAGPNSFQALLASTAGTFTAGPSTQAGSAIVAGAAADLDGDAKLDLALPAIGTTELNVLLGNGDGSFQPAVPYGPGKLYVQALAGDFDGDGFVDVAAAENLLFTGVFFFKGVGDGTLLAPQLVSVPHVSQMVALDYDQDGALDLALAAEQNSMLFGDGTGGFGAPVAIGPAFETTSLAFGDFNGDGELDLAGGKPWYTALWLGDGSLPMGNSTHFAHGGSPRAGDFDEDGRLDLAQIGVNGACVKLNQQKAPTLLSVDGLAAAAAGQAIAHGSGFNATTKAYVGGQLVPTELLGPTELALQLSSSEPGFDDVQISSTFGFAFGPNALARWPALSTGPALIGQPLQVTLENGGPGPYVVAVAGALASVPLNLPGIYYELGLSAPLLLKLGAIPPGQVSASPAFTLPNDPSLIGADLYFQAWAAQLTLAVDPPTSFTNHPRVTVQ